jgi:hypothetical protein
MIYLVSLACTNGHPNGGTPREYIGENPPEAWFNEVSCDLLRSMSENPADWSQCNVCGVAQSGDWQITVGEMKEQTMDGARAAIERIRAAGAAYRLGGVSPSLTRFAGA